MRTIPYGFLNGTEKPGDALAKVAQFFVGVTETGGPNKGPEVEEFQKAVDGIAQGEPYCVGGMWFCIKAVDLRLGLNCQMKRTEHALTLWNETDPRHRVVMVPQPGDIIVWQKFDKNKPTTSGHVDIIIGPLQNNNTIQVVGFNTGNKDPREGDGVFIKTRNLTAIPSTGLRLKGILRPW